MGKKEEKIAISIFFQKIKKNYGIVLASVN
jgi:hypothetical protein